MKRLTNLDSRNQSGPALGHGYFRATLISAIWAQLFFGPSSLSLCKKQSAKSAWSF